MIRSSKLQTKITVMLVIILAVTIGLNNVISLFLFKDKYSEAVREQVLVIAEGMKSQLDRINSLGIPIQDLFGFEEQCKEIVRKYKEISLVQVADPMGKILFSNVDSDKLTTLKSPELLNVVKAGEQKVMQIAYSLDGNKYIGAVVPFYGKDHIQIEGFIIVSVESSVINEKIAALYKYPPLLSLLFYIISFFLIMLALSKWVTHPIRNIMRHMEEVAAGNLSINAEATGKDEIGQMGRTFNRMVRQISDLLQQTAKTAELENRYKTELRERQLAEKLRQVIFSVSSTLDERLVNERILASLKDFIPYTCSSLCIMDNDKLSMLSLIDTFYISYKADTRKNDEAYQMFLVMKEQESPILKQENGEFFLFLPILIENHLQGMIIVQNDVTYSQSEISVAYTYASQVGSFIQNAQLYRQMQHMAATDVLTGICNRRHFFELAEAVYENSSETNGHLGIIMFDIDHFKSVNDVYGHPVGDLVLISVSERVSLLLTDQETQIFGRYGGEEFVILVSGTTDKYIYLLAEQIRKSICEMVFPTSKGDLQVTASLGIAYRTDYSASLDEVLKFADKALYRAKDQGRNCVIVL